MSQAHFEIELSDSRDCVKPPKEVKFQNQIKTSSNCFLAYLFVFDIISWQLRPVYKPILMLDFFTKFQNRTSTIDINEIELAVLYDVIYLAKNLSNQNGFSEITQLHLHKVIWPLSYLNHIKSSNIN